MKIDCKEDNQNKRVKWTNSQVEKLMHWAEVLHFDWEQVAAQIKIKTPRQCKQKYISQTSDLRHGRWTTHEDQIIRNWVHRRGTCDWGKCALNLQRRDGKQCRERWTNVLNPQILKGKWSRFEQKQIFWGLQKHWTCWREISFNLEGRTPNAVKNYVNSSFRSIKNSAIAKCTRTLIVLPTYINPSKRF